MISFKLTAGRGLAGMSKALSVELREGVVAAIAAGASCHGAAARFGVGASSAIRWWAMPRKSGSVAPGPLGGDRRSGRMDAHAPLILAMVERTPDMTLEEMRADWPRLAYRPASARCGGSSHGGGSR
jgi:transposase